MFCLFYSKHLGASRKGGRERGEVLKEDSTLTIKGGETDGLCMGYLQPGGEWGNLALLAETMKNTARACKLEHREILSKILQANEM